jgi:hypothetical protein
MVLYPLADTQPVQTDVLAATTDGNHILGAAQVSSSNVITLTDLGLTIPTTTVGSVAVPVSCVPGASATAPAAGGVLSALSFTSTKIQTALNPLGSTAINQVVTSPVSNLTFITYSAANTNTGAKLPFYLPATKSAPGTPGSLGAVGYVTLSGSSAVTAPLAGAFTPDNSMFFVSTQGDNLIHFLTIPTGVSIANPPVDTKTLAPALPACSATTDSGCTQPGTGIVPATVITVIPRATT